MAIEQWTNEHNKRGSLLITFNYTMSYYPPSENGAKVNMIKQKFEQNLSPREKQTQQCSRDVEELKDTLRRSLSASPVKTKKNLKLNVSRQLSNPGKNIKRTPAFRGDKLSRTKNLQSPTKERFVSIVNQNVKMFEEKPEYGKIGNVKKKCEGTSMERYDSNDFNNEMTRKDLIKSSTAKHPRIIGNSVRTTVISRQKNISPIYKQDDEIPMTNGKMENSTNLHDDVHLEKFFKNGAEYTKVTKQSKHFLFDDNTAFNKESRNSKGNTNDANGILDMREELSRRIYRSTDNDNKLASDESLDTIDGDMDKVGQNLDQHEEQRTKPSLDIAEKVLGVKLTDTLKAALQAPLPVGPPPKKPPRTFAHSPVTRRYDSNKLENIKICRDGSQSDEDYSEVPRESRGTTEQPIPERPKVMEILTTRSLQNNKISNNTKRQSRDSKKMLEKLEHVLIQHQKALGPKVIMPRKETKREIAKTETRERTKCMLTIENDTSNEKRSFCNRLSRTLEDSKKLGSLPKVQDSKTRKHSTFDCLPSLNCASSSVYEQVKHPDFKSYFTETSSLRESNSSISKSEDSLETSISNLLLGNSEFYDQLLTSPATKRLSTDLSTFLDGKKRQVHSMKSEERVYAEPFSFDKNSGTDITGYGISMPEEYNYFSRSRHEERFESCKENARTRFDSSSGTEWDDKTGNAKPELHYMCTSIEPLVYEDNNNVPEIHSGSPKIHQTTGITKNLSLNLDDNRGRAEPDKYDKLKVEQLLNQAFGKFAMAGAETPSDSNASSDTDSLASSASISDELSSFNEKLRLFKNRELASKSTKEELHRSLTEKRKNYVRRVSSKYSEKRGGSLVDRRNKLFEVCLLVELNLSTREPYIKDKYPIYAKTPAWIENFCFPDATNWPPTDSNHNQFYSLALMDERGNRRYGYCCRVRPEDGPILPLAYCLITKYRASGFYQKVLLELESRHGYPDKKRRSFIEELYNSEMPKPGQSLRVANDENRRQETSGSSNNTTSNNNFLLSKLIDSSEKISGDARLKTAELSTALLNNERTISQRMMETLNDSDSMENVIMRSGDPRLEERDMSQLFDAVSNKVLVILFGSLLLERKVVLLCEKLSKLSSCVEALQSLLYPFTWPYTFIPVLPDIPGLSEILQAPLPFIIGILKSKNSANTEVAFIQDGIAVDLDTSKIICAVGDESSILPSRLQKGIIKSALQLVSSNTKSGEGIRNFLVSEAFLRVFVETCSHYDSHLVTQQDGKIIFQKDSFIKASSSKTIQYFLEWFSETTMFTTFIQDCIDRMEDPSNHEGDDIKLFHQRAAEFRKGAEKNAQSKKAGPKKKTLGDRLKDLTNFHS